jgi:hypothetical protein
MMDNLNKDLAKSLNTNLFMASRGLNKLSHFKWGNTPISHIVYKTGEVKNYFNSGYAVNILGEGFNCPSQGAYTHDLCQQRL